MNPQRILSIDLFRGFTIFMMVFVNDLAGVADIPTWMKHVAADADGMTFVDVVFPAFLFIVGMSIPFAVESRLHKDKGQLVFWKHVLFRTIGLLVLGVYMVNSGEMNENASLISKSIWVPLLYIAAVLIWNNYPKSENQKQIFYRIFQVIGIGILVILYFLYRKGPEDNLSHMTPSWWGILGLIGWAYFYSMIVYMLCNRKMIFVGIALAAVGVVHVGINYSELGFFDFLNKQNGNVCHTFIVLAGILSSLILEEGGVNTRSKSKIVKIISLGIFLCVLAFIVRPVTGGISKIGATPSWAFYCSAICCFLFPLFYWLIDIKGIKKWGAFLKPAGTNPLLTYILPPFLYAIIGFNFYPEILSSGILGFLRAVVFSLFILWIAKLLTNRGIVLKL